MSEKRKNESPNYDLSKSHKSDNNSDAKKKRFVSIGQAALLIQQNEPEKLKEIIDGGKILNINQPIASYTSQTLLSFACELGHLDCVKLLVDNNAEINNNNENTLKELLKSITRGGNVEILRYLLEKGLVLNDDRCLLFCNGFIDMKADNEMFPILVQHIQDVNFIHSDLTFLHRASSFGNVVLVQYLLEHGAVHDRLTEREADALRAAADTGQADVVRLLLNWNKTETALPADRIVVALGTASFYDYYDVVRVLVEYGVSTEALNIALHQAAAGDSAVATYLLDQGASVNASNEGMTALTCACYCGFINMTSLLLQRGADPNLADPYGMRPLEHADLQSDLIEILLKHGANPNLSFTNGNTVLIMAMRSEAVADKAALLTILLEHEADPNLADPATGETPLMIAALAVEVDLVKLLLEHGADVTQVNRAGQAVLDMLGRTRKYSPVVDLCEQYVESNRAGAKAILK